MTRINRRPTVPNNAVTSRGPVELPRRRISPRVKGTGSGAFAGALYSIACYALIIIDLASKGINLADEGLEIPFIISLIITATGGGYFGDLITLGLINDRQNRLK